MNTRQAFAALKRAYTCHGPAYTSSRADAIEKTVDAWRAYCYLRRDPRRFKGNDVRGMLRAIVYAYQYMEPHSWKQSEQWKRGDFATLGG